MYPIAAKIFQNFKLKNPQHKMAAQALFLAAQCMLKQKTYAQATKLFASLVEEYQDDKVLRPEAMYWMGDSYFKARDFKNAYRAFKRVTWDYPDNQWAKYAVGRLTEERWPMRTRSKSRTDYIPFIGRGNGNGTNSDFA